jgi:hypothetical protein
MVLTVLLLEEKALAVKLKLLALNVPAVSAAVPLEVKASPRVTVMPTPLTVTAANVLPADVIVPVPLIVIVPV